MRAGLAIVDLEARRDSKGRPVLYELPANDGGGRWEIAGINERYHPEALERIKAAKPQDRERLCAEYIEEYTLGATGLDKVQLRPGTRFAVLDATFNRGPGGSAWMVQETVKRLGHPVIKDMRWGPRTREALAAVDREKPTRILDTLRQVRELYEREKVGVRTNLWRGLVRRWDKALVLAREWNDE